MSTNAIIAGVEEACRDEPVAGDDAQNELFADFDEQAATAGQSWQGEKWDGKGRKPGAKNRVTADTIRYIKQRFSDPMIDLAAFCDAPLDDVARVLECKKVEAFDRQQRAREALIGILYPAKTIADVLESAVQDHGVATVGFGILAGLVPGQSGMIGEDRSVISRPGHADLESEQNQEVSDG